ncbi:Replication factor C, subunit RFC4 [Tieghemiomyces parasiticus]|uniref:Replication factor C, subunit RFC4 n=1 Tax=Tieghemiomyces parasiticus TaxID=78921 RepID=A0A9W7ZYW6_9FUNG|nr:Replication factor C, subunit RFC4 [Tieghemiomyces parasiticus]
MKILTKQEEDQAYQAHVDGGIRGGLYGAAVVFPTTYLLNHFWRPFRSLTLPFKAFLVTSSLATFIMIESERAGRHWETTVYNPIYSSNLEGFGDEEARKKALAAAAQEAQTVVGEARGFVRANQWSIIGGTWVTGMAISLGYLMRQKHMSTMNKLVQARVYAQAITLAALLGTAAIVGTSHNTSGQGNGQLEGRRAAPAMSAEEYERITHSGSSLRSPQGSQKHHDK